MTEVSENFGICRLRRRVSATMHWFARRWLGLTDRFGERMPKAAEAGPATVAGPRKRGAQVRRGCLRGLAAGYSNIAAFGIVPSEVENKGAAST